MRSFYSNYPYPFTEATKTAEEINIKYYKMYPEWHNALFQKDK